MYLKITKLFIGLLLCLTTMGQAIPENFKNPVLPGFYPDPSVCRVGDTYYLVNSSFEWFPGIPIHRSKDLVNWELIGYGLHRPDQIAYKNDLDNSAGIYAPTIRYHEGTFYIITTMIGQQGNFIITANDPEGPWSEPLWIKDSPGIDPSLFWDDDGMCYYTGAGIINGTEGEWPGKNGIWMQKIDPDKGLLIGERKQLTHGHATNARWAEGPHLYKIDGEYLLLIGEGGTEENHSVTVFNSKDVWGPYVPNQVNPVLTHRHLGRTVTIRQTGHADLVQTPQGDWWSVMLATRQVDGYVLLARETFLAKVAMTQQMSGVTPIFNPGIGLLQEEQKRPDLPWSPVPKQPDRDDFDGSKLKPEWNFVRSSQNEWYTQKEGQVALQLRPERVTELANPSFIAQRVRNTQYQAATRLSFKTTKEHEKAGLVLFRRHGNNYQLLKGKNGLTLLKAFQEGNEGEFEPTVISTVPYSKKEVVLGVKADGLTLQFYYGESEQALKPIGNVQDYTILSDEVTLRFNGVMIGMYATSSGEESKTTATFDWFEYKGE